MKKNRRKTEGDHERLSAYDVGFEAGRAKMASDILNMLRACRKLTVENIETSCRGFLNKWAMNYPVQKKK